MLFEKGRNGQKAINTTARSLPVPGDEEFEPATARASSDHP